MAGTFVVNERRPRSVGNWLTVDDDVAQRIDDDHFVDDRRKSETIQRTHQRRVTIAHPGRDGIDDIAYRLRGDRTWGNGANRGKSAVTRVKSNGNWTGNKTYLDVPRCVTDGERRTRSVFLRATTMTIGRIGLWFFSVCFRYTNSIKLFTKLEAFKTYAGWCAR